MSGEDFARWHSRVFNWRQKARHQILELDIEVCGKCEFRDTVGCLTSKCPVYSLLKNIDGANRKLARITRDWPILAHND